ncbi:MAG: DedA family protein [Thermodesulfobacteria bacterium]|nr:DedA family protein [Thermodesulfobacteriota bacterium]
MFYQIVHFLLETIGRLGYPGIVVLMALESSFFPFPSEVIIPPAAYLASKGEFSLLGVIACGVLGSLLGAWFNYFLALKLGRPVLERMALRWGRYFFFTPEVLRKVESFFERHGHISTFVGRLLPGIRQYISLPAGLGRMNFLLFSFYTALGSAIWVSVLAALGYLLGSNEALLKRWLHKTSLLLVLFCLLLVVSYLFWHRRRVEKSPEA